MFIRTWVWVIFSISFSALGISISASKKEWKAHHEAFFTLIQTRTSLNEKKLEIKKDTTLVVAVLGSQCPLARRYSPRLNEFQKDLAKQGVQFIALFPGANETEKKVKDFLAKFPIDFPVYIDPKEELKQHLLLYRTPEVFVFDSTKTLVYRGNIDDQYRIDGALGSPKNTYLKLALTESLAKQPLTHTVTVPSGCILPSKTSSEIDFVQSIAPLVDKNCTYCHRPDEVGAFLPLTNYEEVTASIETIAERMEQRLMPPWRADHHHAGFENDMSLDIQQIQALIHWKDSKMPHGKGDYTFANASKERKWRMGNKPDAIFEISGPNSSLTDEKGFLVPAETPEDGPLAYQHFVVKTNLKEDKWVTGAEVRPTSPEVVHHANVFLLPPPQTGDFLIDDPFSFRLASSVAKKKYGITPEEFKWAFKLYGPKLERRLYLLGNFHPILAPRTYPDGHGFLLPAGAELIFELHYTPNGQAIYDRTALGLRFAKEMPAEKDRKEVYTRGAAHMDEIQIPPQSKFELTKTVKFFADVRLLNLRPHMHNRGSSVTASLEYPDGKKVTILNIPKWDYEWQNTYNFEPVFELKKGELFILRLILTLILY